MKFKSILLCGVAALTSVSAMAIPARRGERNFVQSDGTTVTVNLIGDERNHVYTTTDGLALHRAADGDFYYKGVRGVTGILAHNIGQRTQEEASYILSNASDMQASRLMAKRSAANASRRSPIRKATQVPNNGSPRVPILLVQYKDKKFIDKDPKTTFESFFSHGDTSAYQYFADQSNGKYTPQFDVYGPYTLKNNRSYYGGNDSDGYDKALGEMVAEGCNGLNSQIDFSKYDNDGDGECDVVIVLYAGDGEASSYDDDYENSIWPCQWDLYSSDYGRYLTLDNTVVNKFAVFNEANGSDLSKIDGVGTFCHEFSHCVGLPDFYDTEYSGHFGMAHWSLMDYGSYNNDGYTPIGYSAYEKEFMGWIEIPEVKENTYYTLPVFNQKNIETDQAVKITNDRNKNEYYIIENRARQGWDKFMFADGLLITHVYYDASAWQNNVVNNYDTQRMSPIPADNELKMTKKSYYGETYYEVDEASLLGDLWPYKSATELTDTSVPAAKVYVGSYMGKPVTEMTRNSDGTISFWAMKAPLPVLAAPLSLSHTPEDQESVVLSWLPGDDNDVTYTLEVTEHKDLTYTEVISADLTKNQSDWTYEDYTEQDKEYEYALRLGSSKKIGSVTSPSFTTDENGIVSVVFDAQYYHSDNASVKVELLNASGKSVDSQTIALTDSRNKYVVFLEGNNEAKMSVKFSSTQSKQRVILYSAVIYNGFYEENAAGIKGLNAAASGAYSLTASDLKDTSFRVTGLTSGVKYDCRVKAVPQDKEKFNASEWSESYQFEHNGLTVVVSAPVNDTLNTGYYYNMQGICVGAERPVTPGIYIFRTADKATKILIP